MMRSKLLSLLLVIVSGNCMADDVVSAITPSGVQTAQMLRLGALNKVLYSLHTKLDTDVMFRATFYNWYTKNCAQQERGDSFVVIAGTDTTTLRPMQSSCFATDNAKLCVGVTLADAEHWIAVKQVGHSYMVTSA